MNFKITTLLIFILFLFTGITDLTAQEMCTVMAGEQVADPNPLCPGINSVVGSFDPASGGFDNGMGVVEPQTTNYIAFDAMGNLITVVDDEGVIDLSAFAEGETVCVYQVAYSQENLNTATLFLDDQLCNVLCDPITGVCAGDAIPGYCPGGITPTDLATLFNTLDMAFGFDEEDACDLIDNSILTIPVAGVDVEIDISPAGEICADKSNTPYCAVLTACQEPILCDLMAGEPVPPNATICATGTATMGEPEQGVIDVTAVFGPPTTLDMNFTPVQDYVIVDPVTNEIITIDPVATLELTNTAIGDQACVFSFSYYVELVELLGEGLEDLLCNGLCIPDPNNPLGPQLCPGDLLPNFMCGDMLTDFADILELLNDLNTAQGLTNVTFDDVVELCETQMLSINVGDILGVPGSPDIDIDLTMIPGLLGDGFCCDFSNDPHCVTVIDCIANPPMCSITNLGLSAGACDNAGTADNDADDTFILTINPTGTNTGTTYTISGDVTGTGTYGMPFTTPLPSNMSTITITVTDDMDTMCMLTQTINAPAACSINPPTTDIPTLSQWGLMILALLLMNFGALKMMDTAVVFKRIKQ